MNWKVAGEAVVTNVKDYVGRQLAPRDERLAELEKRVAELVEVNNLHVTTINGLKRRGERHAEHLAKLEGRTKTLERAAR